MVVERAGALRVIAQGVFLIDIFGELETQGIDKIVQISVADAVNLQFG